MLAETGLAVSAKSCWCVALSHCRRTEMMGRKVAQRCVELMEGAASNGTQLTVDLTGGAPELTPQFR